MCAVTFCLVVSILSSLVVGQSTTKSNVGYKFTDGIYLNIEQVKANAPIPKAKLLTSTDYNDKDFFKVLLESDKIFYYDNIGVRQEVSKTSIWGYARNGVLYIQVQGNFNRITFVGSICHFVAEITTYDSQYYSPYGYGYGGYGYPYSYYSPYSYYGYPYSSYPYSRSNMARNELQQYIIDLESGDIHEFDLDNTKMVLMKDQELYEEFVRLNRRKQKDLMFVYIRKYNEKHPLELPSSEELSPF